MLQSPAMQRPLAFPLLICINLARATSRRERMAVQMQNLGLSVSFVDGIDGSSPDFDPLTGGYDPKRRSRIGPPLLKTEIACVASHIRALQAFLASPAEHAVILEDDAVLTENFAQVVAALVAGYVPGTFVRLHKPRKKIFAMPVGSLFCGTQLMLPKRSTMEAIATLYDRDAANALVASFSSYMDAFDTHRGRTWNSGLVALEISPPVAGQNDANPSTIDNGTVTRPHGRAFSRRRPLQWPGFWLQRGSDGVMELIWLCVGLWRMRRHARGVRLETAKAASFAPASHRG